MYYECTHCSFLCFFVHSIREVFEYLSTDHFWAIPNCSALIEPFIARGGQADKEQSLATYSLLESRMCKRRRPERKPLRPASNWRSECSDEDCVCLRITKMCLLCKYLFAYCICLQRRRVSLFIPLPSRSERESCFSSRRTQPSLHLSSQFAPNQHMDGIVHWSTATVATMKQRVALTLFTPFRTLFGGRTSASSQSRQHPLG